MMTRHHIAWIAAAAIVAAASTSAAQPGAADVRIIVDNGREHQRMEGFGATTNSLVFGTVDNMTTPQRAAGIEAAYNQVRLTMGNLEPGLMETPANATDLWNQRRNDNDDPFAINPAGFNWLGADAMKSKVVDLARPYGFDNYSLGDKLTTTGALNFIDAFRTTDYNRYLDECAEHIVAGLLRWRNAYGMVPRWVMPWNEPTSGNHEIAGGTTQILVDLVKRIGERMSDSGFAAVKLVVPGEETVSHSYDVASAIVADPDARQYVGAIAYHAYPYGSAYASPRNIIEASGKGKPAANEITVRNRIRDLGAANGIPVWLTEISEGPGNADYPFDSFENVRARAIHIHDELLYADAAAYYGMNAMWDRKTHEGHFAGRGVDFYTESSSIVLIDTDRVHITGMGYAIGHYARWIRRGAMRIEASSDDSLVQVTAFRDDAQRRLVLVVINNEPAERRLRVETRGLGIEGSVTGEQSSGAVRWQPVTVDAPLDSAHVVLTVPATSVTSISVPLKAVAAGAETGHEFSGIHFHGVYPNPVNSYGEVNFSLDLPVPVTMNLFDESGTLVRQLQSGTLEPGAHAVGFSVEGLAAGVYVLRVAVGSERRVERLVVLH